MSNPSYMRQWGATLTDLGYHVLPIWPSDKKPGQIKGGEWCNFVGWEKYCDRQAKAFELQVWSQWEGCGIGIGCGRTVIGVDLDILDAGLAIKVQELAVQMLGPTPAVRVGQRPKALLVYRVAEPFRSIIRRPIEVLGEGKQFVAYGIHPKTGQPYQWIDDGLADLHLSQLPKVTRAQVEAFIEAALALLPEELKAPAAMNGHDGGAASIHGATATLEAVRSAVEALPEPGDSFDERTKIGMAIWAATRGSEEGYEIFHGWVSRAEHFDPKKGRERWDHWHRSPPCKLGFGSLCYLAQQHGWVPPIDIVFNETLAALPPADFLFEQARAARPEAPAPKKAYQVPAELLDLDGGLKAFVDWCTATAPRPQPFLALAAALPLFGALTGKRYGTRTDLRGNIYTVAIAPSGGGKDHPRKCMINLLVEAGLANYMGGDDLGSGQAILSALHKHPAQIFRSDEFGKQLSGWCGPKAPQHKADIWRKLTQLATSASSSVLGTEYADQKTRPRQDVHQPCACFMGSTVPGPFWAALESGAMKDGSLARFLMFRTDVGHPEPRDETPRVPPPEQLVDLCRRVAAGVPDHDYGGNLAGMLSAESNPVVYVVPQTEAATTVLRAAQDQQQAWLLQAGDGHMADFAARLFEHTAKLAMIRAVARCPEEPEITERDARWAWDLADHCLNTLISDAQEFMADNAVEADLKRLLAIIRSAGGEGIALTKLSKKSRWLKSRDRNEILRDLIEQGDIKKFGTQGGEGRAGRPLETIVAVEFLPDYLQINADEERATTH